MTYLNPCAFSVGKKYFLLCSDVLRCVLQAVAYTLITAIGESHLLPLSTSVNPLSVSPLVFSVTKGFLDAHLVFIALGIWKPGVRNARDKTIVIN